MADEADDRKQEPRERSSREAPKRSGVGGAVSVVSGGAFGQTESSFAAEAPTAPRPRREGLETRSAAESDPLEAIIARLIPSDESVFFFKQKTAYEMIW